MNRKYTAQEMRDLADRMFDYRKDAFGLELYDCRSNSVDCDATHDVICMLRQAADMMEREEREKKYEFSVNPPEANGVFQYRAGAELMAFMLKHTGEEDGTIVRREVGNWEEVE